VSTNFSTAKTTGGSQDYIVYLEAQSVWSTNNVFLTSQLGQKRCMRFVRATGVSRGSYSNVSEFFLTCLGLEPPVGHWTKFKFGENWLGAKC
jgi:hypothetical protein